MEIIDYFGLPSRRGSDFNPWLEQMLECIKQLSSKDFILRLTGDRVGRDVQYQLYNNVNKTYADIQKRNGTVQLRLYARKTPDPEAGFKPALSEARSHVLAFNEAGRTTAADLLQRHLEQDTPYSLGQIVRVKVTPTAQPLEPWTFAGGRITDMRADAHGQHIEVENGAHTYFITHAKLEGHRPSVRKYVLFNEAGDFQFINSPEFEFYFEMKNVH